MYQLPNVRTTTIPLRSTATEVKAVGKWSQLLNQHYNTMFRSGQEVGSENDPNVINSMQGQQRRASKSRHKNLKEDRACGQQLMRWKALSSSTPPAVLPKQSLKCKSSSLDTQLEIERLKKVIEKLQSTLKEAELYAAKLASTVITCDGDSTWALLVPDLHRLLACLQSAIPTPHCNLPRRDQYGNAISVSSCAQKERGSQLLRSLEKLQERWEPHLELLEQVGSLHLEETPFMIKRYTRHASEAVLPVQEPELEVVVEEGSAELDCPSRLSDTVSEVKMPDDDSFLGGGLILMDEDPIILDNEREGESSSSSTHSIKLSETAVPLTTKDESEYLIEHVRREQYSLLSTDQCQVDLDPVVVMDKDLFHGDSQKEEEDAPPLGPSETVSITNMSAVVSQDQCEVPKRKRRAEGTKKRTTGLQCNRRRSLRISKRNSSPVVIEGETGGGSIFVTEQERKGTEAKISCRTDIGSSHHPCHHLEKHNIESSNNAMHQLTFDSALSETQQEINSNSPNQTGVVPCASVKTYSPVIMTKAKAKSSISNCAEEELPPCSTLHPSLEDVEKNYEPLLAPDALSSTTTAKLHTEETTLNHAQIDGSSPLKPLASDAVDWLRASDIVFRMSREMEMNIGGTNVTPGSVVLCAAQLLAEREVGRPLACGKITGDDNINAVCEWLRPLCETLSTIESTAEAQLTESCENTIGPLSRPRSVRFSTFAFSSIDMPHDFCPESVHNAEHAIQVLKAAWKASCSLRHYLASGNTVSGLDAFLRALKSLQCSASTTLANIVCDASKSMGVILLSDAQVIQAAAFYLDEFQSLAAAKPDPLREGERNVRGRNPLIRSPVRLRLTNLIGTTLRFHLRRLLNPPPAGWKGEKTGIQLMTERIKQTNCSMFNVPTRRTRSRVYQLVEMVESNVDKEFSCFRVARNSVKASSMAVSIADGSISCVLSKALHVLSQYRHTDGIIRLECCENFIALQKCHGTVPVSTEELAEHCVHMADLCAAAAARNFVLDLLLFPGFTAAIQEAGGWGPVECLARELNEVVIQEVDCYAYLVLLRDIDSLHEYLQNDEVWKYYDRANTAMNNLEPWFRRLGSARAGISSRNVCSTVVEACCGMIFPMLQRIGPPIPQSSMEDEECTRVVIQDIFSPLDSYSYEARK